MGLGVVGSGVARALLGQTKANSRKFGLPIHLRRILVRDKIKSRSVQVPPALMTTNPQDVLGDPQISVVIELIGGDEPAREYIVQALSSGKHVVTANKEVMAKYGSELISIAAWHGVSLMFEASVGAGIPIIAPLMNDLLANDIKSIHAIINGTTNYILTRMTRGSIDFQGALEEAQAFGYAETDSNNDVEGLDAAYKLAILAALAFHTRVEADDVYREGIRRLEPQDFRHAQELGYAIKLLAIARREGDSLQVRVHPCFVPQESLLAKVDWAYNAIEVQGDLINRVVFHGLGAGSDPTTSAIIGDLIQVGRMINNGAAPVPLGVPESVISISDMAELISKYYIRLEISDKPGVLAQIAKVLGEQEIGIQTVLQKGSDPDIHVAEIVITTHPARESDIQKSLVLLRQLEVVRTVNNLVRIEEWV